MYAARIAIDVVAEVVELPFRVAIGEDGEPVTLPERVSIAEAFHPDLGFVACPEGTTVGMRYVDGIFLPAPDPEAPAPAPLMPITRRQLRLILLAYGILDQVEAAIAGFDEPQRSIAMIEWQDASEYYRDHPLIAQLGAALALNPAQIDAMWREAMAR